MGLKVTVEPTEEPVTLAEAKLHARIDSSDEDDLVTMLIIAARQMAEQLTNRALARKTLAIYEDRWPLSGDVKLLRPPLVSISSVQYVDEDEVLQTVDSLNYTVDQNRDQDYAWLLRARGYEWPTTLDVANAVRVTYQAGYSRDACPPAIKMYILATVSALYGQREIVAQADRVPKPVPFIEGFLDEFRVYGDD